MSEEENRQNISIILVRPEFLGNIGSTCRVMKNFGISDLRLVEAPRNYKDSEARMMAVGAFDILKGARLFDSLETAIDDINLTIATSSGRKRSRRLENLFDVAGQIKELSAFNNKVAFIFGHERNGLKDDELAICDKKIRIESAPDFPSLNLAQAVAVVSYALSVSTNRFPCQPAETIFDKELPSHKQSKQLIEQLAILLDNADFSRSYNKSKVLLELSDVLKRMSPTKRETSLLNGVLFSLNKKLYLCQFQKSPSPAT